MRKIRLDVDSLEVQSFNTGAALAAQGTVHGHTGRCQSMDCYSAGAVECNTFNDPTCGEAAPTCYHSCDPRILCCATNGAASCPWTAEPCA